MVNSVALPPLPEAFPWLSPRISFGHGDSNRESVAIASRISLSSSSSSSGPDQEDLGRLSIDSDKPSHGWTPAGRTSSAGPAAGGIGGCPRMSSSGKIVFHGLERSSSSPGSFTGGPRPRPRRAERSYSANVRVAPVLNVVPACSLRGSGKPVSVFGLAHVFPPPPPPQKKDRIGSAPLRTGLRWPGRPSVRGLIDAVRQPVYPLIAHFPAHGCLEKSTFGYLHRVLPRY
ncbi:hypothetical protein BHE74_00006556, partial [Ensete ventricosum]